MRPPVDVGVHRAPRCEACRVPCQEQESPTCPPDRPSKILLERKECAQEGRAQLVRLRGNQDDGARANGSRRRADKRVYCHEALHLKGKLQTAGYKQAVEKWDTDSDSDSSDEEDLKM